jgi:hypothetical protein
LQWLSRVSKKEFGTTDEHRMYTDLALMPA